MPPRAPRLLAAGWGRGYSRPTRGRITDTTIAHSRLARHRPQSASQEGLRPVNALEVIMVVCVVVAGILFSVWFFVFAGSSLEYQT